MKKFLLAMITIIIITLLGCEKIEISTDSALKENNEKIELNFRMNSKKDSTIDNTKDSIIVIIMSGDSIKPKYP